MVKFPNQYIAFACVVTIGALCIHIESSAQKSGFSRSFQTSACQSRVRLVTLQEPVNWSARGNAQTANGAQDFKSATTFSTRPAQAVSSPATPPMAEHSDQMIRKLPRFPGSTDSAPTASEVAESLKSLSPEDLTALQSLPPACMSGIPGMEFDPSRFAVNPKLTDLPSMNSNSSPTTGAMMGDGDFQSQFQGQVKAQGSPQAGGGFSPEALAQMNRSVQQIVNTDRIRNADRIATTPHAGQVASASASIPIDPMDPLPNPHANASAKAKAAMVMAKKDGDDGGADGDSDADPHFEIYSRTPFPSAKDCAACHEQIFDEWASSSHAYASISPMFHVFEETVNKLTSGTMGYFCLRCHAPVATTMGLRRDQAIWDGPRVFREGVTCVACHRVKTPFGKVDGERRIEPGPVSDPVYGGSSSDGSGVAKVEKYKGFFKVKTNENEKGPGSVMHRRAIQFDELSKSTFCMSCHQVAVKPGIKLEVVWDQYRASPACREGISCQDCHMGIVPGRNEGYSVGPAAVVNDKVINPERKHSNHLFYGPGYSIAHPGIFPDNLDADRWTVNQWLEFDWRAGWGTKKFEEALADREFYTNFPQVWQDADDRYDAREIVDENLKKLEYKRDLRRQLLENGSKLDGPFFLDKDRRVGEQLAFRYCLTNTNSGHNMPSGSLGAQPQIWMNAVLIGPDGSRIWESGYLDSNGDMADNHSLDVLARRIPLDTQLMNLQTKFLTTNVKGTDREMYLPVNFDVDQLPFIRPDARPTSVLNHPGFIRMEGHSIPPLGSRNVKYVVPGRLMTQPGTYQLSVRMRSRAEPIYFMRFCNATPEMQRMMNEWIADFHESTVVFEVR